MKAVIQKQPGGPEVLQVSEVPLPQPAPTEALIKIHATSLNRADTLQRKGLYAPPPGSTDIIGLECAGEIQNSVGSFTEGQRVMALLSGGGYAQYTAVDHRLVMPIPSNISYEDAAAIPEVWLTGYQITFLVGNAKPGEKILVHAAGSGVGTAVIQMAKAKGLQVCATSRSAEKLDRLRELGADLAILSTEEGFDQLKTEWGGVDVILDPVGAGIFHKNVELLNVDGRIVNYGLMSGSNVENFDMRKLMGKRGALIFTLLRSRSLDYKGELVRRFIEDGFLKDFEEGRVRVVVETVDSLENIASLHQLMESNTTFGKIVARVGH